MTYCRDNLSIANTSLPRVKYITSADRRQQLLHITFGAERAHAGALNTQRIGWEFLLRLWFTYRCPLLVSGARFIPA